MRAAVALEKWKRPIFERHLKDAGYTFEEGKGLTDDTMFFYVEFHDAKALEVVVRAAQAEATRSKAN